jgi:hypothetical protein
MSETRTVNTVQAKKSILKAFQKKRPLFLWGPPGIGKSEIVQEITDELGGYMIDLRLGQMDPTDLRGIPYYNKDLNKMDWAPPIELPDEELAAQYPIIVLFFDELNTAPPSMQASAYQLILNRRQGKYRLPDNVVMIAAGNRESDRGVTYRMPAPLSNRFVHQELSVDFNSWQEWAINNKIHPSVVGYLSFAKQDLYDYDNKSASRSFATPRAWSFVSQFVEDEDIDTDTLTNLIAGTIGEGLAVKFMAHRKYSFDLPTPENILSGKATKLETKEISAMYSLVTNVCYELKIAASKDFDQLKFNDMFDNFLKFSMDNFETELVVMASRIVYKIYMLPVQPLKLKHFPEFHKKYGKYVIGVSDK